MLRFLRIACEVIASLAGIAIMLALFLIWRLGNGPMQATFLTPTIESSIESLVPDTRVSIAYTLLAWNDTNHSITLHADQLDVRDKEGRVIAGVSEFDTQLSLLGIVFGQFLPVALMVEHPHIRLERQPDGTFTFGGTATGEAATVPATSEESAKKSLARLAGHLAHSFFTRHLVVDRAVFDIHDIATNSDWTVTIPKIALQRTGHDLAGRAAVDMAQQDRIATVTVNYSYDRREDLHRLTAHFNDITPAFFAGGHPATLGLAQAAMFDLPLTGDIGIAFDSALNVAVGNLALHGGGGFLKNTDLWDKPRAVSSLDIRADYDRRLGILEIPSVKADFGGARGSLSGKAVAHDAANPFLMDFSLRAQLDNWPMDNYGDLWPKPIIPGARDWIAENLSKGRFDHAEADLKGTLDLPNIDNSTFTDAHGKVTATGGRVRYMDSMPPVEGVNADATFDMNQLTAQISGGGIGAIQIVPFTLQITGFEDDVQNISIPLKVAGPIPDILALIDHPPLGYTHAIGLTPGDITGDAAGEADFRFPLLRDVAMKDVGIAATATLSNVASSRLVKGLAVTQGQFALNLTTEDFDLKGPAAINSVPLQVELQQNFTANSGKPLRQASVTGALSADQWHALGVDVFAGTRGAMNVALQMTQADKDKTLFSGSIDMTPAEAHIDKLDWQKPAQAPAAASFAAERTVPGILNVTAIDLHGPQLDIQGAATVDGDGTLQKLDLKPMIAGRTNVTLHLARPAAANGALRIDAEGEALDISGFKSGTASEPAAPQPEEFHIKVTKLYGDADGFITKAEGYAIRDAKGWSEIDLHGLAEGDHPLAITLAVRPDGGRDFSVTCDDFGAALKGLGFADTVRGGKLDIDGSSDAQDPRAIVGRISVGSFNVGKLPLLAVLMNAASPFGFAGLFSGSMDFDHIRGKFRWEGDTIRLDDVHAAGASVGINIDGVVDTNTNNANLHGTMVPFSMINSVIGAIPLIGNIFTGGKDQGVFAVAYTIKGPLDAPKTSVNPASLLTPGFVRNLFFSGGDDEEETPDEKAVKP
jgi:hypothetical protein